METKIKTFGASRFFKYFMAFGALLFAILFACSIMETILQPALRWPLAVSSAIFAVFTALCVSVLRMTDDTVEISDHGVSARRRYKPDTEMAWEEIVTVDDFMQARCLKLRSADGRMIRIEFQFENFPSLLDLLELNLTHLGNSSGRNVFGLQTSFRISLVLFPLIFGGVAAWASAEGIFYGGAILFAFALLLATALLFGPIKVEVDPDGIRLIALLRRREIKYADISYTRLELAPQILTLSVKERQTEKEIKLTGFKQIFHLSQLIRHHHEHLFDE